MKEGEQRATEKREGNNVAAKGGSSNGGRWPYWAVQQRREARRQSSLSMSTRRGIEVPLSPVCGVCRGRTG